MRLVYLFVFVTMLLSCTSQKNELTTNIKAIENIHNLKFNPEKYQNKEVVVLREPMDDRLVYLLTIFRNEQGTLNYYSAYVSSLNTYDEATYEWVNDSTVTFHLKNNNHNHESYTVMGYGRSTTLITN